MIYTKRIYDQPDKKDGFRILVDRLWPRGVSKSEASLDRWMQEIAPSNSLRQWFEHDENKWKLFKEKYWEDVRKNKKALDELRSICESEETITLLYASKEEAYNNAEALKEFIEKEFL